MMINVPVFLQPNWPLQEVVVAGSTTTMSPLAKEGFNLAQHVDDSIKHVRENRRQLLNSFARSITPMWLSQTHSNKVIRAEHYQFPLEADAGICSNQTAMPVVLTADCLPILLSDTRGELVAAIHAGWPGLYKSIIAHTIANMPCAGQALYAWIGPAISQQNYEVDEVFFQRFIALNSDYSQYFVNNRRGHYLADLLGIARYQLVTCGLMAERIYESGLCSYDDKRFFSYRRDGSQAGRMASFIFSRYRAC